MNPTACSSGCLSVRCSATRKNSKSGLRSARRKGLVPQASAWCGEGSGRAGAVKGKVDDAAPGVAPETARPGGSATRMLWSLQK
jgi:hypothetical protein